MNPVLRLRSLFLARSRREKVLAMAFLVVFALIWASAFLTRASAFRIQLASIRATADSQAQWMDSTEAIEARYREAVARLSDATLPSRSEVLAQVDALVRKYRFTFRIDPPQTQARDRFTFHAISIAIDKADYGQLQAFQTELTASLPTVNLEQITLIADRRNPAQLDTRIRLVAIEFSQ